MKLYHYSFLTLILSGVFLSFDLYAKTTVSNPEKVILYKEVFFHSIGNADVATVHGYYVEDCMTQYKEHQPSSIERMAGGSGQRPSATFIPGVELQLTKTSIPGKYTLSGVSQCPNQTLEDSYGHLLITYGNKRQFFPIRFAHSESETHFTLSQFKLPTRAEVVAALALSTVSGKPFLQTMCPGSFQFLTVTMAAVSDVRGPLLWFNTNRPYIEIPNNENYQNQSHKFTISMNGPESALSEALFLTRGQPSEILIYTRSAFFAHGVGSYTAVIRQDFSAVNDYSRFRLGNFQRDFGRTPMFCEPKP